MSKAMNAPLRVGIDVASLSDTALTGIPLYIESLLREYLTPGREAALEEWVLAGSQKGSDLRALLQQRGIPIDLRVTSPEILPAVDFRLAAHLPGLQKSPFAGWLVRKVDGRVLLPLGNAATSRRMRPVDVMHHTAILRIAPQRAKKNIVTIYDLTTRFFPETHQRVNIAEWEKVFTFARERADMVVTDSESARQDIVQHLGVPEERVRAIPLGVRPLPLEQTEKDRMLVRRKFGVSGRRFVLSAGSLEPRKNLPRLIEAFAALVKMPEFADVALVLTGARLHGAAAVEEAVARHGLTGHVVLAGYVSDEELAALMRTCDCFIYPSIYEGFGLPVVEAMAMGAAVATSQLSSLPEVAGDAALLFNPKSTSAITDTLCRMLSDTELVADLRRRSVARAALFSWRRCAREHRELYHEIAG